MKLKRHFILAALSLFFISEQSFSQQNRADSIADIFIHHPEQIMVAAHRSAHQHYPENSLSALRESIRLGVDIVETDVRQTKDGVLVIMHDAKVDRTTNGKGKLSDYTYQQLLELRLVHEGKITDETVPTLEQFLREAHGKILVDLDFKLEEPDALKRTYEIISNTNTTNQVLFFLYQYKDLARVNLLNPKIKIMPRAYSAEDVKKILAMNIAPVIHIDESYYSDTLMKSMRDKNIRIWSNALGKYDKLEQTSHAGFEALLFKTKHVNVIQTDLPEECLAYLKKKGLRK